MCPQGLSPGLQDHRAPALPAEVATPTRPERLARRVAQEGPPGSRGREEAEVQGVGDGKHQGERGHREHCGCPVLPPLPRGTGLALRAVPMATGMLRVPLASTGGTGCRGPPERRRPAGLDSGHHLRLGGRYGRGTAVSRTGAAEDSGACPCWSAGLAPGCRLWAVGGRRGQGLTPGSAGGGPAGQAVERTAERGQRLPRDPEIPRGGIERLLPQPQLDRPDSAPRVQQGRRKTMALIPRAE